MRGAVLGVVLAASALVLAPDAASAAAPSNTAARTGVPANIYAVGDSITTSTGTDNLGAEHPVNSWVTGTSGSVNSMRARLGISTSNAVNLAHNGKRMQDFDDQAGLLPSNAQYVVVELGGNDLCRDSVAEMTSVADYRTQFQAGLQMVADRAPEALIFVASIPDVYNLWYIRGAPSSVNPHVADQTGQDWKAHLYWDTFSVIPCRSMVDNPTSTAQADVDRRNAVRARNLAFNDVLAQECAAVLRCRFDGHNLFNKSSNRVTPQNGPYLPRNQWWFEDNDISHDDGTFEWLCPAPGVLSGGTICGDHFHPSVSGQAKLAQAGHEASYQFQADATAPTATTAVSRPPDGNGVYAHSVQVTFGGTDASGVRGQEVRVQGPSDSAPGPWQPSIGLAPPLTVSATGTTYVQVRTLDVNGNLSASTTRTVTVDPSQFDTVGGTITGPDGALAGVEVSLHAAGTEGALRTTTTDAHGAYAFTEVLESDAVKVFAHDPTGDHVDQWYDGAATHAAATPVNAPATADIELAPVPGTVAGTVSDNAGPIEGIRVDLHAADTLGSLGSTTTDGDGHWSFDEVLPGSYKVQFSDDSGVHVAEWHDNSANHASASTVTVTSDQTTTVDATLALTPGSITGTVSGPDGPLEGIAVTASPSGATTTTDSSGGYELADLAPGTYTVGVADVPCTWVGDDGEATVPTGGGSDTVDLTLAAEEPGPHGFSDVPAWVDEAVRWLVDPCNEPPYMEGYPDQTFRPAQPITRGAVVRAVWRIAGQPTATAPNTFSDTPAWVDDAVSWAVEHGYMTGYPGNTFRPNADITRAEAARMFFRIAGAPPQTPGGHGLSDVPAWVDSAVTWLVTNDHAGGYPDHTFRPTNPITRAEFARIAFRVNS